MSVKLKNIMKHELVKPCVGLQMYTLRDYTTTQENLKDTLVKLKNIGYSSVELAYAPVKAVDTKAMLDNLGLLAWSGHFKVEDILNNVDGVIADATVLGLKAIVIPYVLYDSLQGYTELMSSLMPSINKIVDKGFLLLYHNHHQEFVKYNGISPMQAYLDMTTSNQLGLEVDCYWLQYSGINPVDFITKHAKRIKAVHFKDMQVPSNGDNQMSPLGLGNMNYEAIYKAVVESNIKHIYVEQDICDIDPFTCVTISKKYMDNLVASGKGFQ